MKLLFPVMAAWLAAGAETAVPVSGTIRDPHSGAIAGAAVTLYSRTANTNYNTTSSSSGSWRFDRLPTGTYIVRIEAPGFASFVSTVDLGPLPGQSVDVVLQLATVRNEVVVTASSTPQTPEEVSRSTTVIDRAEEDDRDSGALADAVALSAGMRVQQLGGPGAYTTLQIRGLRPEDTAVLVDGLRFRDASATQGDASDLVEDLLLADTDQIEVLRGSGSSLYGTNAIGGVVNLITAQGGGQTHGSLLMEGGSLGLGRARAQIAGGSKNDSIEYSLGVSQIYVANGVGGDAPFRDTNLQGRVTFRLSPTVQLAARLFAGNSFEEIWSTPGIIGNPSGTGIIAAIPLSPSTGNATFFPAPDDPGSTRAGRYLSGALLLTGQPSAGLDYSISYQILSNSRRYGNGPAGAGYEPAGNNRSRDDGRTETANAHIDYHLGNHDVLSAGYEFERETYAADYSDTINLAAASGTNATQLSHTVFVQDRIMLLGDRLQIGGAFRSQFFSLDQPAFALAASAPYQGIALGAPSPAYTGDASIAYFIRHTGTKWRAHAGRGYRAPSLFERFGTGFDPTFGYSVYGDPRLQPEHSLGGDAGVDQSFWHGRAKASATYFYTSLQNVIVFDTSGLINPATDPFGRYVGYINTSGGISRGVELSAAVAPVRSLNITTAYTFVNAIERTPIVSDILRTFVIPRNQVSIQVTEHATSRLWLTFEMLAAGNYLAPLYSDTVTQVYRFDGIHKVNAGASYRLPLKEQSAVRFFVRAENLLGQTYFESGYPTPGRTGRGGLQFEF
jgi:vitamin B12 transporter